jgi:phage FluMu protein Com
MSYLRCANCGLLVHSAATTTAVIKCARCRVRLEREIRVAPIEYALRHLGSSAKEGPGWPGSVRRGDQPPSL